jgi:hypothetical protein
LGSLSRSKRFGQPKCGPRHSPRYGRRMSVPGRFCCKSLFALVIKISFGCTRDFRVNMWGTSLPEDKLAGGLGNVIGATSIGGRRSDFFTARKLAPGNLGLLQQYRHKRDPRFIGGGYLLIGAKRTAICGAVMGAIDPRETLTANFAVMHNAATSRDVVAFLPWPEGSPWGDALAAHTASRASPAERRSS